MSDTLTSTADILAGNAIFTVRAADSDERYTFWIIRPTSGRNKGRLLVRLLTGPLNTSDYEDIGTVDEDAGDLIPSGPIALRDGKLTLPAAVARWFVQLAANESPVPAGLELIHAGRCLRCGRLLTVPYPDNPYRLRGMGPECGGK